MAGIAAGALLASGGAAAAGGGAAAAGGGAAAAGGGASGGLGKMMGSMPKGGGGGGDKGTGEKIAGIGALAMGIGKGIFGLSQLRKAKRIKPVRPTYKPQKEIKESAAMWRNQLYAADPVEKRAEENIASNLANQTGQAAKYASSGTDVLNLLGNQQMQANKSTLDLAAQSSERRASNMSAYQTALKDLAREKQKAFDYNKVQSFDEKTAAKSALQEGGIKNLKSGAQESIAASAKLAGGKDKAKPEETEV